MNAEKAKEETIAKSEGAASRFTRADKAILMLLAAPSP
jgi:hypothetical protein